MMDYSGFDIIEYLDEIGITYTETGKNVSQNWLSIACPYCDDQSNHCGINIQNKVFSCFRCSEKGDIVKLISKLENKSFTGTRQIIQKFTKKEHYEPKGIQPASKRSLKMVKQLISENTTELTESGTQYLVSRGFDPSFLSKTYSILSGKPGSLYTQRILIPYTIQGKAQTFSTRDTSGKAKIKYLHCPVSQSVAAPKELLFGIDHTTKDTVLILEGVFDVFRIGRGSVAVSGTQYTRAQILLLSEFKRIFILFDPEPQAQEQAYRLAQDLSFCSASVEILKLDVDCDPGDLDPEDVKVLRREIFGRIY